MNHAHQQDDPDDTGAALRALYSAQGGVASVFDAKVADYQASRPDYPEALFDTLAYQLAPRRVADVGAGTGLLTQGLLARGWQVLAVEPNAAMRAACDARLGALPGYRSAEGRAEAIPAADASLDLITAAQAFHWFEPEAARAEALRVLSPAGQVALIWNDRQRDQPLHRALDEEVFERYGGERRLRLLAHEDRGQLGRFFGAAAPREWQHPHRHGLGEAGLISLVFSRSYMPRPDSEQGRVVSAAVRDIFARFAREGQVQLPYTTVLMLGRPG
jgi:SAM-dependent methyltransferase